MKTKVFCSLIIYASINPTYANIFLNDCYTGGEIIQTNQNYKSGFGKRILQDNPQDYAIFAGSRFFSNFGVEIGFESQPKRTKNAYLAAGDASPGRPALIGAETAVVKSSIKGRHVYLGIFGETSIQSSTIGKIRFQLLIAPCLTRMKAQTIPLFADGLVISENASAVNTRNYQKTKIVPMLKLSMINNFTPNFGIRLSANYRMLSRFKIHSKTLNDAAEIRIKDSLGIGLGLVYLYS